MAAEADVSDLISPLKREVENIEVNYRASSIASEELIGPEKKVESSIIHPIEITKVSEARENVNTENNSEFEDEHQSIIGAIEGDNFLQSPSVASDFPDKVTEEDQSNYVKTLTDSQKEDKNEIITDGKKIDASTAEATLCQQDSRETSFIGEVGKQDSDKEYQMMVSDEITKLPTPEEKNLSAIDSDEKIGAEEVAIPETCDDSNASSLSAVEEIQTDNQNQVPITETEGQVSEVFESPKDENEYIETPVEDSIIDSCSKLIPGEELNGINNGQITKENVEEEEKVSDKVIQPTDDVHEEQSKPDVVYQSSRTSNETKNEDEQIISKEEQKELKIGNEDEKIEKDVKNETIIDHSKEFTSEEATSYTRVNEIVAKIGNDEETDLIEKVEESTYDETKTKEYDDQGSYQEVKTNTADETIEEEKREEGLIEEKREELVPEQEASNSKIECTEQTLDTIHFMKELETKEDENEAERNKDITDVENTLQINEIPEEEIKVESTDEVEAKEVTKSEESPNIFEINESAELEKNKYEQEMASDETLKEVEASSRDIDTKMSVLEEIPPVESENEKNIEAEKCNYKLLSIPVANTIVSEVTDRYLTSIQRPEEPSISKLPENEMESGIEDYMKSTDLSSLVSQATTITEDTSLIEVKVIDEPIEEASTEYQLPEHEVEKEDHEKPSEEASTESQLPEHDLEKEDHEKPTQEDSTESQLPEHELEKEDHENSIQEASTESQIPEHELEKEDHEKPIQEASTESQIPEHKLEKEDHEKPIEEASTESQLPEHKLEKEDHEKPIKEDSTESQLPEYEIEKEDHEKPLQEDSTESQLPEHDLEKEDHEKPIEEDSTKSQLPEHEIEKEDHEKLIHEASTESQLPEHEIENEDHEKRIQEASTESQLPRHRIEKEDHEKLIQEVSIVSQLPEREIEKEDHEREMVNKKDDDNVEEKTKDLDAEPESEVHYIQEIQQENEFHEELPEPGVEDQSSRALSENNNTGDQIISKEELKELKISNNDENIEEAVINETITDHSTECTSENVTSGTQVNETLTKIGEDEGTELNETVEERADEGKQTKEYEDQGSYKEDKSNKADETVEEENVEVSLIEDKRERLVIEQEVSNPCEESTEQTLDSIHSTEEIETKVDENEAETNENMGSLEDKANTIQIDEILEKEIKVENENKVESIEAVEAKETSLTQAGEKLEDSPSTRDIDMEMSIMRKDDSVENLELCSKESKNEMVIDQDPTSIQEPEEPSKQKSPEVEMGNGTKESTKSVDFSSLISQEPKEDIYEEKIEDTKNRDGKVDIAPPMLIDEPIEEAFIMESQLPEHEIGKEDHEREIIDHKNGDIVEEMTKNLDDIHEISTNPTEGKFDATANENLIEEFPKAEEDSSIIQENSGTIPQLLEIKNEEKLNVDKEKEERKIELDVVCESKDHKFGKIHEAETSPSAKEQDYVPEDLETEASESTRDSHSLDVEDTNEVESGNSQKDGERETFKSIPELKYEFKDKTEATFMEPDPEEVEESESKFHSFQENHESEELSPVQETRMDIQKRKSHELPVIVHEPYHQGIGAIIDDDIDPIENIPMDGDDPLQEHENENEKENREGMTVEKISPDEIESESEAKRLSKVEVEEAKSLHEHEETNTGSVDINAEAGEITSPVYKFEPKDQVVEAIHETGLSPIMDEIETNEVGKAVTEVSKSLPKATNEDVEADAKIDSDQTILAEKLEEIKSIPEPGTTIDRIDNTIVDKNQTEISQLDSKDVEESIQEPEGKEMGNGTEESTESVDFSSLVSQAPKEDIYEEKIEDTKNSDGKVDIAQTMLIDEPIEEAFIMKSQFLEHEHEIENDDHERETVDNKNGNILEERTKQLAAESESNVQNSHEIHETSTNPTEEKFDATAKEDSSIIQENYGTIPQLLNTKNEEKLNVDEEKEERKIELDAVYESKDLNFGEIHETETSPSSEKKDVPEDLEAKASESTGDSHSLDVEDTNEIESGNSQKDGERETFKSIPISKDEIMNKTEAAFMEQDPEEVEEFESKVQSFQDNHEREELSPVQETHMDIEKKKSQELPVIVHEPYHQGVGAIIDEDIDPIENIPKDRDDPLPENENEKENLEVTTVEKTSPDELEYESEVQKVNEADIHMHNSDADDIRKAHAEDPESLPGPTMATEATTVKEFYTNDEPTEIVKSDLSAKSTETTETVDTYQQDAEIEKISVEDASSIKPHLHDHDQVVDAEAEAGEITSPVHISEPNDQVVEAIHERDLSPIMDEIETNEIERKITEVSKSLPKATTEDVEADGEIDSDQIILAEKLEEIKSISETGTTVDRIDNGMVDKNETEILQLDPKDVEESIQQPEVKETKNGTEESTKSVDSSSLVSQAPKENIYEEKIEDTKNSDGKVDIAPPMLINEPNEEAFIVESQLRKHEIEKEDHERETVDNKDDDIVEEMAENLDAESESYVQNAREIHETSTYPTEGKFDTAANEKVIAEEDSSILQEDSGTIPQLLEIKNEKKLNVDEEKEERKVELDAVTESKDHRFGEIHETETSPSAIEQDLSEDLEAKASESTRDFHSPDVENTNEIESSQTSEKFQIEGEREIFKSIIESKDEIMDKTEAASVEPDQEEVEESEFSTSISEFKVQYLQENHTSEELSDLSAKSKETTETADTCQQDSESEKTSVDDASSIKPHLHEHEETKTGSVNIDAEAREITEPNDQVVEAIHGADLSPITDEIEKNEVEGEITEVSESLPKATTEDVEADSKIDSDQKILAEKIEEIESIPQDDGMVDKTDTAVLELDTKDVEESIFSTSTYESKVHPIEEIKEVIEKVCEPYHQGVEKTVDGVIEPNETIPMDKEDPFQEYENEKEDQVDDAVVEKGSPITKSESKDQVFEDIHETKTKQTSEISDNYKMEEVETEEKEETEAVIEPLTESSSDFAKDQEHETTIEAVIEKSEVINENDARSSETKTNASTKSTAEEPHLENREPRELEIFSSDVTMNEENIAETPKTESEVNILGKDNLINELIDTLCISSEAKIPETIEETVDISHKELVETPTVDSKLLEHENKTEVEYLKVLNNDSFETKLQSDQEIREINISPVVEDRNMEEIAVVREVPEAKTQTSGEIHESKTIKIEEISGEDKMEEETKNAEEKISDSTFTDIEAIVDDTLVDETTGMSKRPIENADEGSNVEYLDADEFEQAKSSESITESKVLAVEDFHETETSSIVGKAQTDKEEDKSTKDHYVEESDKVESVTSVENTQADEEKEEIYAITEPKCEGVRAIIDEATPNRATEEINKERIEEINNAPKAEAEVISLGGNKLINEPHNAFGVGSETKTPEKIETVDIFLMEDNIVESNTSENEAIAYESRKAEKTNQEYVEVENQKVISLESGIEEAVSEIPDRKVSIDEISPVVGEVKGSDTVCDYKDNIETSLEDVLVEKNDSDANFENTDAEEAQDPNVSELVSESKVIPIEEIHETETSKTMGEACMDQGEEIITVPEISEHKEATKNVDEENDSAPKTETEVSVGENKLDDVAPEFKDHGLEEIHETKISPTTEIPTVDKIEKDDIEISETLSGVTYMGVEAMAESQIQEAKAVPEIVFETKNNGEIIDKDTNANDISQIESKGLVTEAESLLVNDQDPITEDNMVKAEGDKIIDDDLPNEDVADSSEMDTEVKENDGICEEASDLGFVKVEKALESESLIDTTKAARAINEMMTEASEKDEAYNIVSEAITTNEGNVENSIQVSSEMDMPTASHAEQEKDGENNVDKTPIIDIQAIDTDHVNIATESIKEGNSTGVILVKHEDELGHHTEKLELKPLAPAYETNATIEEQEASPEITSKGENTIADQKQQFISDPVSTFPRVEEQIEKPPKDLTTENQKAIIDVAEIKEFIKDPQELDKIEENMEKTKSIASRDFQVIQDEKIPVALDNTEARESKAAYESTEKSTPSDLAEVSFSKVSQELTREIKRVKEEPETEKEERALAEEDKPDQEKDEEEEDEQAKVDSGSDGPVMVEASRDIDVKSSHKKSHNILSGVGSKVKHSIAKVKKAIIGKSSHNKASSPKEDKKIESVPLL